MRTPQGYKIENETVVPVDWFKIVFNPSFPYRLVHMTIAAFIVAGFIVAACGAAPAQGRRDEPVKRSFSMALWMLLVLAPIQIVVGDAHGLNTREYQPAKIAAIEGLWETEGRHRAEPLRVARHAGRNHALCDPGCRTSAA